MEDIISEAYMKYYDVLLWDTVRRVHSKSLAEDCVQESFCILAEKSSELIKDDGSPDEMRIYPFLKKVCSNLASKCKNDRLRICVIDTDTVLEDISCPGAEEEFFKERLMERLEQALENQLPETRTAIFYKYGCGMTYAMIGKKLNRSENSVQKIVSRAIDEIKEAMEEQGYEGKQ